MATVGNPPPKTPDAERSLLRPAWANARYLRPRISADIQINSRIYRGEQWYVLQRKGSKRIYRINRSARLILGRCDGSNTLEQILAQVLAPLRDNDGTRGKNSTVRSDIAHEDNDVSASNTINETEMLRTINHFLHEGFVTVEGVSGIPVDALRRNKKSWWKKLENPLAIRIPLWDPDQFLLRHIRHVRPLFGMFSLLLWLCFVIYGVILAGGHWPEITHNVIDRILQPANLLWLWLIYPATKFIHEMGHAFATRACGGEVHEIGIMILFGIPIPYVDASAASAFVQKRHRLLVDAIGIMLELGIAVAALLLWLAVEPGLVSQFAYNTMIICSVSTLLFNGNPLARFDGYYLLADFLELPNLGDRAASYWGYLFRRYAFGVADAQFPTTLRERCWLATYGVGAFFYRTLLLIGITWIAMQKFLLIGLGIGLVFSYQKIFLPAHKLLAYLTGTRLGNSRRRAISLTTGTICAIALWFFFMPINLQRVLPAVVWMPEQTQIRATTQGIIHKLWINEGEHVETGQILITLEDPYLTSEKADTQARLAEANALYQAARVEDIAKAVQLEEEIKSITAALDRIDQRIDQLTLRSRKAGIFYLPAGAPPPLQRFVTQGDLVAYVVKPGTSVIHALVSQEDMGLLQKALERSTSLKQAPPKTAQIWIANWPSQRFVGHITRATPAASRQLPSAVLGSFGGGDIPVDPMDESGQTAVREWFQLEITLEDGLATRWLGARAWVNVDLDKEPMGTQLYRHLRQLFMKDLSL